MVQTCLEDEETRALCYKEWFWGGCKSCLPVGHILRRWWAVLPRGVSIEVLYGCPPPRKPALARECSVDTPAEILAEAVTKEVPGHFLP